MLPRAFLRTGTSIPRQATGKESCNSVLGTDHHKQHPSLSRLSEVHFMVVTFGEEDP